MSFNTACKPNLALANDARLEQTLMRQRLKAGELGFDEFLDETPCSCRKLAVAKVLTWLPGIRASMADKIIEAVPLPYGVQLFALTQQERYRLYELAAKRA